MSSDFSASVLTQYLYAHMYERLTGPCNTFSPPNWFQSHTFGKYPLYCIWVTLIPVALYWL